jgi:hypothetical protein
MLGGSLCWFHKARAAWLSRHLIREDGDQQARQPLRVCSSPRPAGCRRTGVDHRHGVRLALRFMISCSGPPGVTSRYRQRLISAAGLDIMHDHDP